MTMTGKLDEISFEIGKIVARLDSLNMDITQDRAVTAQDRAAMNLKLGEIDKTMKLVEPVCAEVAAMKPHIEDFKTMRVKLAIIATLVGGAVALFWQGMVALWPYAKSIVLNSGKS